MSSTSLSVAPGARPWTPPDTDSDFASGSFSASSIASDDLENRWPLAPNTPPKSSQRSDQPSLTPGTTQPLSPPKASSQPESQAPISARQCPSDRDSHVDMNDSGFYDGYPRGDLRPSLRAPSPHTPIKGPQTPEPQHEPPRYPYTPDSARTNHPPALLSLSPLPSFRSEAHSISSPVQSALFSCLSHLENLIQTRQPNDVQMEYLVNKFEEMAQFLSAPEAQSRQSDDHLFSELDTPSPPSGLGIMTFNDEKKPQVMHGVEDYVIQVGKFIEGVRKHTEDLKMRMDEIKQLNSIQVDIIEDLRRGMRTKSLELSEERRRNESLEKLRALETRSTLETLKLPEKQSSPGPDMIAKEGKDTVPSGKKIPQQLGFWAAVGEALDAVGAMLHEW